MPPLRRVSRRLNTARVESARQTFERPPRINVLPRNAENTKASHTADTRDVTTRGIALLAVLVVIPGCGTDEPTVCEGFADRKLAITGAEYRGCAGKILEALDSIEPPLRAIVAERANDEDRNTARRAYRTLRTLIRQTGVEDDYRSMRPGTVIMKWPNGPVSSFNSSAVSASVQYMAVLAFPNRDNFAQGVKAHEDARRSYNRIQ